MIKSVHLNPLQFCFINTPSLYERFVSRLHTLDPLYHEARLTHLHFEVPPPPIEKPTRKDRRQHFWDIFCTPNPHTDRCVFVSELHDKVKRQQEAIRKTGLLVDNTSSYLFIIGKLDDLDTLSVAHLLPKYISNNRANIWGNAQTEYASIGLFYLPNSASLTDEQRAAMFAFWEEARDLHNINNIGFKKIMLLSDSNTSSRHRFSYAELSTSDLEDLVIEILLGLSSSPDALKNVTQKDKEQEGLDDETMSIGTCTLSMESRFQEEMLYADFVRKFLAAYSDTSEKLLDDDAAKTKAIELAKALPIEPDELSLNLISSGKGESNILQRLKFNWENLRPPNLNPFNFFTPAWLTQYIPTLQKLPMRLKVSAENLLSLGLMNFRYALDAKQKSLEVELEKTLSLTTDDLMRNPNTNHLSPTQTLRTLKYLLEEIQKRDSQFRAKAADIKAFEKFSFLSTKDENELYASSEWAEESENDATKEHIEEHFNRLRLAIERFPVPLAFWSRYFSLALVSGYLGEYILGAIPPFVLNIGIQTVTGLPFVSVFIVVLLFGFLRYHRARMNVFHHRNLYVSLVEKAARREAKKYLLEAIAHCYQVAIKKVKSEIDAVSTLIEHLKSLSEQPFQSTIKEETLFHRSIWGKIPIVKDTLNLSSTRLPELEQPILNEIKFTFDEFEKTLDELIRDEPKDTLKSLLNQFAKLSFTNDKLQKAFDPFTRKPFDNWRKLLEPPPNNLLQVAIPLEHEPENEWHRLVYLCKSLANSAYSHIFNTKLEDLIGTISENIKQAILDYFEKMSPPPVPQNAQDGNQTEQFIIAQPAFVEKSPLLPTELRSEVNSNSNHKPKTMIVGNAIQWFYWKHFQLDAILWHEAAKKVFERLPESEKEAMYLPEEFLKKDSPDAQSSHSDDSPKESFVG